MADRIPKPGTAIYLLRDVPRTDLMLAHASLARAGEGRTLKQALLDTVAKLAATEARRRALMAKVRLKARTEAPAPAEA